MRYDVGRFRRPMRRSTEGQLMSLISLGDGSTLTLDFTTGVLDPRLTFTRASNATFINSSGLVEWAAANMFINSAWTDANNTPTGWTLSASTGTISRSGETRTFTCAAQQYWFFQQPATKSGLTYTLSFEITAVSGTFTLGDVLLAGSSTSSPSPLGWYKDGAFLAGGGSTQATTGRFALVFTANADNTICRIGLGTAGVNVTGSVTIRYTQIQPGIYPSRVYLENTSTSAANHNTPRFDYDPTTLTPRGLLIEGSASNLVLESDTLPTPTNWVANSIVRTNVSAVTPDGNTTATTCGLSHTGSGSFRSQTVTVVASTTYTFSFWAKNNGGSVALYRAYNASGSADIVAETSYFTQINSSTWTRVRFTFTTPVGCTSVYVYPLSQSSGTSNLLIWGAQLEAGSGSSYIPTGASQVTRNADECSMTGTNFSSWFNASAGTLLVSARTATRYVDSAGFDFPAVLTLDSNNHIGPCQWNGVVYGVVRAGGSYRINYATLASPGNNANYKAAIAYADSNYAGVANGGSIQTGSGTTVPSGLNQLALGTSRSGVAGNFFGHISQIKYWPTRLPNAQLQSLST